MSALMLLASPPVSQKVRLITAKNLLVPAFGGAEQELLRKGSRYQVAYDHGEMDYIDALDWSDVMIDGAIVVAPIFQPGLDTGAPGAAVVNGAGQGGKSLMLRTVTPGYVFRKGQFLSVISAGQRYLYRGSARVAATAGGLLTIPLHTLLRRPPADGDVVEIVQPMIEGSLREVSDLDAVANHEVKVAFTVREQD
jgi:hypothetical protein